MADGEVIPDKGEATLQFEVDGLKGQVHALTSTFQVAKVSKPLRSVSVICDAGFDVLFTKTGSLGPDPRGWSRDLHLPTGGWAVQRRDAPQEPRAPELPAAGTVNHPPGEPLSPSTTPIG